MNDIFQILTDLRNIIGSIDSNMIRCAQVTCCCYCQLPASASHVYGHVIITKLLSPRTQLCYLYYIFHFVSSLSIINAIIQLFEHLFKSLAYSLRIKSRSIVKETVILLSCQIHVALFGSKAAAILRLQSKERW